MTAKQLLILPVALLSGVGVAQAEDKGDKGEWRVSAGIDYSSGDYGDESDTDILFLPASVAYKRDNWGAKVTVSWLDIDGPGSVIGGGDGGVVVPGEGEIDAFGFGDVWAEFAYGLEEFPEDWGYLDLVGKVKFPTANDDKGLGTGEFDYTLQADFFKPLGKFSPMATVAYKIKGSPSGVSLDNVWYLSVGADYRINEALNCGLTLDFQEASSDSADDALELFGYLGVKTSENTLMTLYGYAGLLDGSPDAGGGLQWRLSL